MKSMIAVLLLAGLAGVARAGDPDPAAQTGPVEDRSRICMMQDSLQPKPGLAYEYEGKTYWLCCAMCQQVFSADPERYAHARDPVSGREVDKATAPAYAVGGRAFYFDSEDTRRTFAKDPSRYLHGG